MLETAAYAHTPGADGTWHPLQQHLHDVARAARELAAPFGGGEIAYWAGLWHDLGKFNPAFQAYLQAQHEGRSSPTVPHSIWGSALAYRLLTRVAASPLEWKRVAMPIFGHHAGLPAGGRLGQVLETFLSDAPQALPLLARHLAELPAPPQPRLPARHGLDEELFIRIVFSALVDADFLDTEHHFQPARGRARRGWPRLDALWQRLSVHQQALLAKARDTAINRLRREVYEACLAAALGPPGVYRLTAPTGSGKTLSGLAFALRHATIHGLRRIIIAIPYTSIIDQTADVYRGALGPGAVVEHHSQVRVPEDERQEPYLLQQRLASENWCKLRDKSGQ